MRDLVDICPDAESECGEEKQRAEARGCDVYVGNNLIVHFDEIADDYAYTHAKEYARRWNRLNGEI